MRTSTYIACGLLLVFSPSARSEDPAKTPRPVPLTRPEMKQILEDMKDRKPRIPLPELTDEDKANLGDRADQYEARLRYHYMPRGEERAGGGGGGGRGGDGNGLLKNSFKVELFWIVSRTNNCQYCLGHQEMKLAVAGLSEERIAGLDGDWAEYTPAERAAYAFARKITLEPHLLNDADIEGLRKFYKDTEILEMILSVSGNNSINRWKEGTGVPQSRELSSFAPGGYDH